MDEQAKRLVENLQTHDLAETLRLRRAKWAQEAGLPPAAFGRPFPGNRTTVVHQHGPGRAALGGVLGLVLGAAGAAVLTLRCPPPAPAVVPPAPAPPPKVGDVELEVRWRLGPDGHWQATVEPVGK